MVVAGATLVIDGIVTLSGSSGSNYRAYRIFVSGSGAGVNHVIGRGEVVSGVVVAALSVGLWRGSRWGWIVGVIFGLAALGGWSDASVADRIVAACGAALLVTAFLRYRESRRLSTNDV